MAISLLIHLVETIVFTFATDRLSPTESAAVGLTLIFLGTFSTLTSSVFSAVSLTFLVFSTDSLAFLLSALGFLTFSALTTFAGAASASFLATFLTLSAFSATFLTFSTFSTFSPASTTSFLADLRVIVFLAGEASTDLTLMLDINSCVIVSY